MEKKEEKKKKKENNNKRLLKYQISSNSAQLFGKKKSSMTNLNLIKEQDEENEDIRLFFPQSLKSSQPEANETFLRQNMVKPSSVGHKYKNSKASKKYSQFHQIAQKNIAAKTFSGLPQKQKSSVFFPGFIVKQRNSSLAQVNMKN